GNAFQKLIRDDNVGTAKFKKPHGKSEFDSCWMHKTPPCFVCVSIILPQIPLFAIIKAARYRACASRTISHRVMMGAYADIRGCPGYPVTRASSGIIRCDRSRYDSDCRVAAFRFRRVFAGGWRNRYPRRADPLEVAGLALGVSTDDVRRSHSCFRPLPDLDSRRP